MDVTVFSHLVPPEASTVNQISSIRSQPPPPPPRAEKPRKAGRENCQKEAVPEMHVARARNVIAVDNFPAQTASSYCAIIRRRKKYLHVRTKPELNFSELIAVADCVPQLLLFSFPESFGENIGKLVDCHASLTIWMI